VKEGEKKKMVGVADLERILSNLSGVTQPVSLSAQVAASGTETETYTFSGDGVIQGKLQIRIYAGPELDLTLYPVINRVGDVESNIIQYVGDKEYIDGDDDAYEWDIFIPVKKGEQFKVKAVNANATHAYDYRVNFSVNYVKEDAD